jgi:hypothetical protein
VPCFAQQADPALLRLPQVCLKTPTEIPLKYQWPWKTRWETGEIAAQRAADLH